MLKHPNWLAPALLLVWAAMSAAAPREPINYFNQDPPGPEPQVFAPGFVSTSQHFELNSVFLDNGQEFYFSRRVGDSYRIFVARFIDDRWRRPQQLSLIRARTKHDEVDVMIDPIGRLYFISDLPVAGRPADAVNIWFSVRERKGWGAARVLPDPVNSDGADIYPSFVRDGEMYFSSNRDGGFGARDIYRATFRGGKFTTAINAGRSINSRFSEGDVFVDPDERFLIVTVSGRPDSRGGADLYVAKREGSGWGDLRNMGSDINTEETEYCPVVTPDGKYLMFSRAGDIYWMDVPKSLR